ncbi:hypothetical protein E8L90_04765 [Brevibacillus antibioticus]|uniref:Uncharacterized protein n=1 Tax=Brevibacillus antibioticus TaxID=2570228 RepID=A0A4U2Y303_9BACL|nr:hypothetical protein [Brevibacillus antibioticus]TKI54806.1 hypothetical protein E8L90_04765 [Brevibacillus antibioticus]
MIIKKVLIGNNSEAFMEERFSSGVNIISSDDNNKGKTIVIQSMMYALGNDPIFPSSFRVKNYYFIVELEISKNELVSICRKGNSFIIIFRGNISIFDNLSEFKYFVNRNLFNIPTILKDGSKKLVDPMLLYQMFFVGQDNKDTSNIFLNGYYKKEDFVNMLYSYNGILTTSRGENEEIRKKIKSIVNEKKVIENNNKILKSAFSAIGIASMANDREKFEAKLSKVEKIKNSIIQLNSKRNNAASRKIKNEITLKELRSLNQTLNAGELHCLDCHSVNVGYSTADSAYTFDISSIEIRNQILTSIEDKINAYKDEIDMISLEINRFQEELKSLLSQDEVSIESLLMYKSDLVKASDADSKLLALDNELKNLHVMLNEHETLSIDADAKKKEMYSIIIEKMNEFYKAVDPQGNMIFNDLFSKRQSVYSGVEETEFYLSKLYALLSVLNHPFPIVMDYFRDGELSSSKERKVLELFGKSKNQVILTVTLKEQELGKYDNHEFINHIDYTPHTPSKLLTTTYVDAFLAELKKFSLSFE